jgi:membrane protease YdiL (CAAX protease family)
MPKPQWIALGAVLSIPTVLLASGAISLLHHALGVERIDYLSDFTSAGYSFGWAVLLIAVQPAIIEELAFRGVILSALEPVLGGPEALLVSALMFAILHLSVPSIPHLFVLGIVLAWLRQRTGSLYAGMVAHFSHNLLVLLAERHGNFLSW